MTTRTALALLALLAGVIIGLLFVQFSPPSSQESILTAARVAAAQAIAPVATLIGAGQATPTPTPAPTPAPAAASTLVTTTVALINAGGPALRIGDQEWQEDRYYKGGDRYDDPEAQVEQAGDEAPLYQTERNGTRFSYRIPVPQPGLYLVRLHFLEIYWSEPGQRVFDVSLEDGVASLPNYDIVADVGPRHAAIKEFQLPVEDGVLSIDFKSSVDHAQVSAIEVLALTPAAAPEARPQAASSDGRYYLAPDGATERCGTPTTPCQAPQYLPTLPAGALILAAAGNYPQWRLDDLHGNADQPITIKSASGGRDLGLNAQLRITNAENLVVDGVALDGGGLWIENTENITVRNTSIRNAPDDAVRFHVSLHTHLSGLDIHDSAGTCIAAHVREQDRQDGQAYHGSDLKRYSFGAVIENSTLTNCGFQGIFLTTMSPIIRNNQITSVGVRVQEPRVHGIYSKAENALIENNTIDGAVHNGISVRNTAIVRGNIVRHVGLEQGRPNLYGGACYGFFNDGPQTGGMVVFENNLCSQPGPHFTGAFRIDGTTTQGQGYTFVIRNNSALFQAGYGLELVALEGAQVYAQHNILLRQDNGDIVSGQAGGGSVGDNLLKANAGDASDVFVDPANQNFALVKPLSAAAAAAPAEWSPEAQSPSLADPSSIAPTDMRGHERNATPSMGALEAS